MDRSDRGTEAAAARRESALGRGRERLRPLALPALAAAMQAVGRAVPAKQAARRAPIVHEDEPVV